MNITGTHSMNTNKVKKMMSLFTLISLLSSTHVFAHKTHSPAIGLSKTTEDSEIKLFFQLPDGIIVVKKPNAAPFCKPKGSCDFPIDCYGNDAAPKKGFQWKCKNTPKACHGYCYQVPVSNNEGRVQKVLATVVSE
jgi:hypothetical protein